MVTWSAPIATTIISFREINTQLKHNEGYFSGKGEESIKKTNELRVRSRSAMQKQQQ